MNRKSQSRSLNQRGFSLVEILVAAALLGIVGLGLASLMTEMAKQQQANNIKALFSSQKLKLEQIIKDDKAWSATVADANNTHLDCLKLNNPNPCTAGTYNGLEIYEAAGSMFFDSRGATNGFTFKGVQCSGFDAAAATTCPFRWDISTILTCSGALATCRGPTIRVLATLNVNPLSASAAGITVNPANYAVDVTRGVGTRFDPILIVENVAVNATTGAGTCSPGGVFRRFNADPTDPAENVSVNAGTGVITFQPGSYQCRITAPAYKVGVHTIVLEETGGTVIQESAPAISPNVANTVTSNAILEVAFVISTSKTYRLRHKCQSTPSLPDPPSFALGFGAGGGYGAVTFATMSCYRNG